MSDQIPSQLTQPSWWTSLWGAIHLCGVVSLLGLFLTLLGISPKAPPLPGLNSKITSLNDVIEGSDRIP